MSTKCSQPFFREKRIKKSKITVKMLTAMEKNTIAYVEEHLTQTQTQAVARCDPGFVLRKASCIKDSVEKEEF